MAHASLYAFGANMMVVFISIHFGIGPSLIAAVVLTGALAMLFDHFLLAPLRTRQGSSIMSLITAVGFNYVVQNLLIAFLGSERKQFPDIFGYDFITIFGQKIQASQVYLFGISLVLLLILMFIVYRTKLGMAMRATQQNTKAANLMGINVRRVITVTFFISGVYAAIAGFLISGYYLMAYPSMGVVVGNKAFAAAVLGGIGNLPGSVIGGLIVGLAETYVTALLGGGYRDAIAFVILILVLIFRPNGLFGKKDVVKL